MLFCITANYTPQALGPWAKIQTPTAEKRSKNW